MHIYGGIFKTKPWLGTIDPQILNTLQPVSKGPLTLGTVLPGPATRAKQEATDCELDASTWPLPCTLLEFAKDQPSAAVGGVG